MQDNTLIPPSVDNPLSVTVTKVIDGGIIPSHPIQLGHTVQGWIFALPEIDQPFYVLRTVTNGREALGQFTTSAVTSIEGFCREGCTLTTRNSVYRVEFHPEDEFDLDLIP